MLNQMNVYSHVIAEKIANSEFHGNQVSTAQNLQTATATLATNINQSFRTAIESNIADQEALLGI